MPSKTNPFRLDGKVAVVTGAARGIGRAAAMALASAGADVAGIDVSGPVSATLDFAPATRADLTDVGLSVEALGRRWLAITLDQREISSLRLAASKIQQDFGGIDILFANAGIQAFKPILDMEDADSHAQAPIRYLPYCDQPAEQVRQFLRRLPAARRALGKLDEVMRQIRMVHVSDRVPFGREASSIAVPDVAEGIEAIGDEQRRRLRRFLVKPSDQAAACLVDRLGN